MESSNLLQMRREREREERNEMRPRYLFTMLPCNSVAFKKVIFSGGLFSRAEVCRDIRDEEDRIYDSRERRPEG